MIIPEEITSNVENDLKVLANFTVILTIHIPVDMEVYEFKVNGQIVNLEGDSYTFKIVEETTNIMNHF